MINSSQLEFHETFQPELGYISKIMELASNRYTGTKFDISECTGIPTGKQKGKVEPHIKYANYMGLIDFFCEKGIYSLSLTNLGKEVFVQDKYLHENLTHWLCHYGISRQDTGAPQWAYLVTKVHPGFIDRITPDFLFSQANIAFGMNINLKDMPKKVFSVVKGSYTEGCFSGLGYLNWDNNITYVEHNEKLELIFVYAYAILSLWEAQFPDRHEITMLELQDKINFGKVFGFNEDEVNAVLDSLDYEGILTVNRQLFPATIIRTSHVSDIFSLLYSRLL